MVDGSYDSRVRGADDHLSVGERIAFYRRRRGYTQSVLAGLMGRSEDWLSKIERGEREIRRLDVLTELAALLRVTLGDLLGQPVLMEDDRADDDVQAVRDALMAPRRLSRLLYDRSTDMAAADPERAARLVEHIWDNYQAGRLGRVIAGLPGLIRTAQQLEEHDRSGGQGRAGWVVSARTHHLAATALAKFGEADLAWIAAERSMQAADMADDPLVLASAARAGTHALLAVGRYADALDLGGTAAEWLKHHMRRNDPEALSLFGMLHLRAAVAAARHQDRQTATGLLARAQAAAAALGRDANYWQTGFGPTNVQLHRLSVGLDLGDIAYVVEHSSDVDLAGQPTERRVSHLVDVARAQSLAVQDDDALGNLLTAEQESPTFVRHSSAVRETVRAMHRRATTTGRSGSSALAGLAERCRAV